MTFTQKERPSPTAYVKRATTIPITVSPPDYSRLIIQGSVATGSEFSGSPETVHEAFPLDQYLVPLRERVRLSNPPTRITELETFTFGTVSRCTLALNPVTACGLPPL